MLSINIIMSFDILQSKKVPIFADYNSNEL